MEWLLLSFALIGCGRIRFDTADSDRDAATIDATPDAFEPSACPASYDISIAGSNHRYRRSAGSLSWLVAANQCAADSPAGLSITHLAMVDDETERVRIAESTGFAQTWIGVSDRLTEGTFLTVTNADTGFATTLTSPPWDPGEPNDMGGIEDCVELNVAGRLNDNSCANTFGSVCECDGVANAPTRY